MNKYASALALILATILFVTLIVYLIRLGDKSEARRLEQQMAVAKECRALGGMPIWYHDRVERCERGCQ